LNANSYYRELLAELGKTVTPEKAGVQKSLKNLDSGFRRNDDEEYGHYRKRCDFRGGPEF